MKRNWMFLLLCFGSFVASLVALNKIPDQIPMHWNLLGQVDFYGNRYHLIWMAALPMAIYEGLGVLMAKGLKQPINQQRAKGFDFIRTSLAICFLFLSWSTVYLSLDQPFFSIKMPSIVIVIAGILLIVIGNYLPVLPANHFVGIRTPWTLKDEVVWKKVQRLGGYSYVVVGFLLLISAFTNQPVFYVMTFILLMLTTIAAIVYSYFLFRKRKTMK